MIKTVSPMQLDFKDVLIKPSPGNLSSRSEVELVKHYAFLHSPQTYIGIPIIVANMDKTGTMTMARALSTHQCMTALHKHYSASELIDFFKEPTDRAEIVQVQNNHHHVQHTFYSMGMTESDFQKFKNVVDTVGLYHCDYPTRGGVRMVCIDVANGYMKAFSDYVTKIRNLYPDLIIMAGNVVCPERTQQLLASGADIVKIGIGSGSVCQTRVVAGVGRPQFSAILDCQNALNHTQYAASSATTSTGYIVSDGGITCIADFSKAFAVGAFGVMAGGVFSGHDECETHIIERGGEKFLEFYGMSSTQAMDKYAGGTAHYRASEGKTVYIPYKGSIHKSIQEILGGIRSAHTYVGARNFDEFSQKTEFYLVSQEVNEIFGKSK